MARGKGSGGANAPTGQASPAKSSGTARGFTPPGAKGSGGGGPAVIRTGGKLTPAPRKSANKVQGG
jgi:hypothetical protein